MADIKIILVIIELPDISISLTNVRLKVKSH